MDLEECDYKTATNKLSQLSFQCYQVEMSKGMLRYITFKQFVKIYLLIYFLTTNNTVHETKRCYDIHTGWLVEQQTKPAKTDVLILLSRLKLQNKDFTYLI